MKKLYHTLLFAFIFLLLQACVAGKYRKLGRNLDSRLNNELFSNQFTGLWIFDPIRGDTLYRLNSQKYFTPASNTKIFTLFAGLKLLPDNIPSLQYLEKNDTLFIKGMADPSLLHPYFKDSTAIQFIRGFRNVALCPGILEDTPWGPGWAWEDYDGTYAPERTALPLYGNVVEVFKSDSLRVIPKYFRDSVKAISYRYRREKERNLFYFGPDCEDTLYIPFRTDTNLTRQLLQRASGHAVLPARTMPEGKRNMLYGIPTDSLYKRMMQESDNFLAEQLLIAASGTLSDTLNGQRAREYILDRYLEDIDQLPVWVDGSGLSRYNLFTPESIGYVLYELFKEVPRERLFSLFAAGGVSGTLEDWYPGRGRPYLFAKTGTLANNHCLSGYLVTRSGKVLIFSFMNNHFRGPSAELKAVMKGVFEELRDHY